MINKMKAKLQAGKAVVGTIVTMNNATSLRIIGQAGFDYLLIDTQHAPLDIGGLNEIVLGLGPTESEIVIRVAYNKPWLINQVLDVGADGVIVPLVNTREEAENAVSAAKYPPDGVRSWGPKIPEKYASPPGYWARANNELMVLPQIESVQAVENLDEILSVKGLDGIMIGPTDLTLSMGHPQMFPPELPEVDEMIQHILAKCKEHKVPFGHFTSTLEVAEKWIRRGGQIATLQSDQAFMATAAGEALSKVNDLLAEVQPGA